MTKEVLYLYTGTNGSILSPIHLEDTFYSRRLRLWADEGKALTKNGKDVYLTVVIPVEELELWYEI